MTEKTHAVGSLVFATGAFLIMDQCKLLDPQIAKIAQYGIITPYALWGAQIPDFDQDNPNRIVTNPINRLIMDLFKVLNAKHRGLLSHILPVILSGITFLLMCLPFFTFYVQGTSLDVLRLMVLGLFLGLLSHLILDMCTKDGIYFGHYRIALVPKMDVFKTGTAYEKTFRKILYAVCCILCILCIIL